MALRSRDSLRLTDQLNSEWRSTGLNFRIMLVGESGLGKTTFTRALLRPYVPDHLLDEPHKDGPLDGPLRSRTVDINEMTFKIDNDGFPVEISIVDCPGYGDAIDSTAWIDRIKEYLRSGYATHYQALGNPPVQDSGGLQHDGLVHVCLYFIAAHRLKGVDLEFMRRLEPHVNLVPIIAKADTMTLAERDAFRRLVLSELKQCGVKIFQMNPAPGYSGYDAAADAVPAAAVAADEAPTRVNGSVYTNSNGKGSPGEGGGHFPGPPTHPAPHPTSNQPNARGMPTATTQPPPFAVCASEDGTRVYPWGTCCVEDPSHSDLSLLRSMLFASSMIVAKRKTLELYESSYARDRRAQEAEKRLREARALRREKLLGRLAIFTVASGSIAMAGFGALKVLQPGMAARVTDLLANAMDKPGETVVDAAKSAASLLGAIYARLRGLNLTSAGSGRGARAAALAN